MILRRNTREPKQSILSSRHVRTADDRLDCPKIQSRNTAIWGRAASASAPAPIAKRTRNHRDFGLSIAGNLCPQPGALGVFARSATRGLDHAVHAAIQSTVRSDAGAIGEASKHLDTHQAVRDSGDPKVLRRAVPAKSGRRPPFQAGDPVVSGWSWRPCDVDCRLSRHDL